MKKILAVSVVAVAVLLTCAFSSQATDTPDVTIELLNPPPNDLLTLAVGASYTFKVQITSDEPFILAMAMPNAYYPGRGIYWHDSDRATHATHATSALLHLTMTGKDSTADLPAVCDWPEPGDCWSVGTAPVLIAAGVRYQGGLVVSEQFVFEVVVP
jgi:hypothetical protein